MLQITITPKQLQALQQVLKPTLRALAADLEQQTKDEKTREMDHEGSSKAGYLHTQIDRSPIIVTPIENKRELGEQLSKLPSYLSAYELNDGVTKWWYAAESVGEAIGWAQLQTTLRPIDCLELDPDSPLVIHDSKGWMDGPLERSTEDWANSTGQPYLIATTSTSVESLKDNLPKETQVLSDEGKLEAPAPKVRRFKSTGQVNSEKVWEYTEGSEEVTMTWPNGEQTGSAFAVKDLLNPERFIEVFEEKKEVYNSNLKVFEIDDGKQHWWIDWNEETAKAAFIKLFYTDTKEPLTDDREITVSLVPPEKMLTIDDETCSAELWVQKTGSGLLGSAAY